LAGVSLEIRFLNALNMESKRGKVKISVLSSGSCGNCFYIENDKSAVLIDAGISCRQIMERLEIIKRTPEKIKGIFITHEHSDHIKGCDVFSRKFNIPVFSTRKTAESCFLSSNENLINTIKNNDTIKIGGMEIEAFSKSHSAAEPVSFSVSDKKKASIITDLGHSCTDVTDAISNSDFLCLESNYDSNMLDSGPYPHFLKQWIQSNSGHLSNLQAGLLLLEYSPKKLKNILLCHLSRENNTPNLALCTAKSLIKERFHFNPAVKAMSRGEMSGLIRV